MAAKVAVADRWAAAGRSHIMPPPFWWVTAILIRRRFQDGMIRRRLSSIWLRVIGPKNRSRMTPSEPMK
jgi:hypothetical protein